MLSKTNQTQKEKKYNVSLLTYMRTLLLKLLLKKGLHLKSHNE